MTLRTLLSLACSALNGKWAMRGYECSLALGALALSLAAGTRAEAPAPERTSRQDLERQLPQPVLSSHPEWVRLYWAAWRAAVSNVRSGTDRNGFAPRYIDEGYNDRLYHWDSCFIVLFARYGHHLLPSLGALDSIYRKQNADGFASRELSEVDGSDLFAPSHPDGANPPLSAWAEWSHYRLTGDVRRLQQVRPFLVRGHDWVRRNRRRPDGLYWNTRLGSGMDNSPRMGQAWVDMTAQQALSAESLSSIARRLGDEDAARRYEREYVELRDAANTRLWDEERGLYFDAGPEGLSGVATIASFWPLIAGIPDEKRMARLGVHLADPSRFWRAHPFASLAADHPDFKGFGGYWKGGVWPPANYATIKGLERYGLHALARQAAEAHLEAMTRVYLETGTIWEYYAADTAGPANNARRRFVGWSGLGPIALLIESILGLEVDAAGDTLTWRLWRQDEHGIRDLRFGDNVVSLVAQARPSPSAPVRLVLETDSPFTLHVDTESGRAVRAIDPGTHLLEISP